MTELSDTQLNRRFIEQWEWIPGFIRHKFTPTSVVSILVAAFSCGTVASNYRGKFHTAEIARAQDHQLLVKQTEAVNSIAMRLEHLDGTLQGLDRRLSIQEEWQLKVIGTAETINIPRISHRVKHPP